MAKSLTGVKKKHFCSPKIILECDTRIHHMRARPKSHVPQRLVPKATTVRASRLAGFVQRPALPEANTSLARCAIGSSQSIRSESQLGFLSFASPSRLGQRQLLVLSSLFSGTFTMAATARIIDFLRTRKARRPLPRGRPRRCARTTTRPLPAPCRAPAFFMR